ncbi:MAG: cytochrome c biogenesis protein ResB [Bacteroidota bacterium]
MKQIIKFFYSRTSYNISFFIAFSLVFLGFFLNYFTGTHKLVLDWPVNIIVLIVFVAIIVNLNIFSKNAIVAWLSSIPASISAICTYSFLVFLMGLIPQNNPEASSILFKLGLTDIVSSWSFLLISFYLLTILGFVIMKRLKKFNFRNSVFILNHLGLWITVTSALLGSSDVSKYQMSIAEGHKTNIVTNDQSEMFQMPFDIQLIDFKIDEYIPNIILVNPNDGFIINDKKDKSFEIKENAVQILKNWEIKVLKYYENGIPKDSSYSPSNVEGAVPVAYIEAKLVGGNQKTLNGWITSGSKFIPQQILYIEKNIAIAMTIPTPKKFSSSVKIYDKTNVSDTKLIEVNKPLSVGNWKIYQIGYDAEKGKWSKISTFEIVNDPWINGVYFGIGMLLIGSLLLFWVGKTKEL